MKKNISHKTKAFIAALGAFVLLAILLVVGSALGGIRTISSGRLDCTQDRTEFLLACGWEVEAASETEQLIHIPEHFSSVYESYNALQIQQGYDLLPYAGKDCTMFTYNVTNYPDDAQTVLACLYLYEGRVIGGDVHSTNLNGFMIGLK